MLRLETAEAERRELGTWTMFWRFSEITGGQKTPARHNIRVAALDAEISDLRKSLGLPAVKKIENSEPKIKVDQKNVEACWMCSRSRLQMPT
jgi:hypothetical protein